MKKFFALLKVSVKSMLFSSTSLGAGRRKRTVSGLGIIGIMAFLALYISGVYSSLLLEVLAPLGREEMVFIYMGIAAVVGGLLYTVFAVKGVVFGGKDNDLLLSMPVSSTLLMASRVTAIYLESLIFSFFMLVPAGVACALFTESGVGHTLLFWVRLLLAAIALPLLDTALSVLLGAAAAFLSTRVSRGKLLGRNLVMGAFLALVFWFSFRLNGMIAQLAADPEGVRASLSWAAPFLWMGDGIAGDWGRLMAFAGVCLIPFLLMVAVLGRGYRRFVTAFSAQAARGDYRLTAQKSLGRTRALLAKEAKRFFGSTAYFWNAGLGLILMLVMGGAALVKGGELRALAGQLSGLVPVLPLCGAAMGFCLSTCAITAPSVSLEGDCFWILRSAPVGEGRLLGVKVGFQLLLSIPCTLIASGCLTAALALPVWQGAILFSVMALFAAGQACFGLLMGLTFPRLDAANETVVVKQSLSVLLSMFVPMGALALAGVLYWLGRGMGEVGALSLPAALFALLTGVCAVLLVKKGPAMVRKL